MAEPAIAPTDGAACQKAIGSASRGLLKVQLAAERKCLDRIAGGKLSGDPDVLCRGAAPNAPTDPTTAAKIAKAVLKLETTLGAKCPDATVSELGTCGQTASELAGCLAVRASSAAFTLTSLLYGDVTSITDSAALSCQKSIGKAGTTELASIATAMQVCLDKMNAGAVSGDPSAVCLGAWTSTGPLAPTDVKTAVSLGKAAVKAAHPIQAKCSAAALAPLRGCGGGSAAGVADCIRCAVFSQAAGLVDDSY
jgi:hypothetical protein